MIVIKVDMESNSEGFWDNGGRELWADLLRDVGITEDAMNVGEVALEDEVAEAWITEANMITENACFAFIVERQS